MKVRPQFFILQVQRHAASTPGGLAQAKDRSVGAEANYERDDGDYSNFGG